MDVTPYPKSGPKPKRRKGGRARPDEPLADRCETADLLPEVCKGRAEQRHHILRRGQGGTDDASNTLDICGINGIDGCHDWIHSHIPEAEKLGLLRRSTFQPTHETENV